MTDHYEFGIFNADKAKICAANSADPNDPNWAFLWTEPFSYTFDEQDAQKRVQAINNERLDLNQLETHGPVKYMRRRVNYGKWEDAG
jgi:hypothetical protein